MSLLLLLYCLVMVGHFCSNSTHAAYNKYFYGYGGVLIQYKIIDEFNNTIFPLELIFGASQRSNLANIVDFKGAALVLVQD